MKLIRILGHVNGAASAFDGLYVKAYDASVHWPSGRYDGGRLETTADPAEALRFADAGAAVRLWQSGPECKCHALREDGLPNRPMTVFTVAIEEAEG